MLAAGTTLGPYTILAPLGAGGMGEVYRARDTRLGRDVAIKIIPTELARSSDRIKRFEQEARAAGALNHPNVCALFDIGTHDGSPFVVMELLEGESLRSRLNQGPIPARKAAGWAAQAAHGLAAAHEKGIVHRDLKPENLFLTKDARVKVLDFGLAKLTRPEIVSGFGESPVSVTPTETGMILGTVGYMAPEQVRGEPADHRTDLFALGTILHELLTGKRAFSGGTFVETSYRILHEEPPPLSTSGREMPAGLEAIMRRCLEKSPEERFQSARDLAFALGTASGASGGAATGAAAMALLSGATASGLRSGSRRLLGLAAAFLAGAVLIGALAIVLRHGSSRFASRERPVHTVINPPPGTQFSSSTSNPLPLAVSPDGARIAFCARQGEGPDMLWVRALDADDAKPIAGTEGASGPFFSPDGRSLGFFADWRLKRVEVGGGPVTTLARAHEARGGTWGRDGVILFTPEASGPILQVPAGGGATLAATTLDTTRHETTHRYPQFLPDGRHFLFLARSSKAGAGEEPMVCVGAVGSRDRVRVLGVASNVVYASGHLLFVSHGSLMAQAFDPRRLAVSGESVVLAEGARWDERFSRGVFAVSQNGLLALMTGQLETRAELRWVGRDGSQSDPVGEAAEYTFGGTPVLAPDGKRALIPIVDLEHGLSNLWAVDLATGERHRLTLDDGDHYLGAWSPDGRDVVTNANSDTELKIIEIVRVDGTGNSRPLWQRAGVHNIRPFSWSPDRRSILFADWDAKLGGFSLFTLAADGASALAPLDIARGCANVAQFSPDGRFICYDSDETGRSEVYVAAYPGPGGKWQVSSDGGVEPRWSRNSREIFYFDRTNRLTAVEVTVSATGIATGPARPFFRFHGAGLFWRYDVGPDASRFLVATAVQSANRSPPITIVVNWPALAGKR